MTTFSHSLFFCPSSFCVREAGVSMGDITFAFASEAHTTTGRKKQKMNVMPCVSCQSKQPQKINIFLRGKQNAIFIFILFSPARPCVCVCRGWARCVVSVVSCVVIDTSSVGLSGREYNTREFWKKKKKIWKSRVWGFFVFEVWWWWWRWTFNWISKENEKRKREKKKKKRSETGRHGVPVWLIVHFPRVSFLFFPSARAPAFTLLFYLNITRMANFLFSFFFFYSSQVRNCQFSERTFQFIQFRCLNG